MPESHLGIEEFTFRGCSSLRKIAVQNKSLFMHCFHLTILRLKQNWNIVYQKHKQRSTPWHIQINSIIH